MAATAAQVQRAPARPRGMTWHRALILAGIVAAAALVLWLTVYGFSYYTLDAAHRSASPKHTVLKPGGSIGRSLGLLGSAMYLVIFLYAVRKRWTWLSHKGMTRHWLDFHILLGITAPIVISFHASFKFQGVAGLSYWVMLSVVISGFVGRYLYAQIPRRLDAAEMSFDEMQALFERQAAELSTQEVLRREDISALVRMPRVAEVQKLPLLRALWLMILLDLQRPVQMWRLRRRAGPSHTTPEFQAAMAALKRQAALSKKILFFSKARQIFHWWHIIHRPFSYSFAALAALHIAIVFLLGFY